MLASLRIVLGLAAFISIPGLALASEQSDAFYMQGMVAFSEGDAERGLRLVEQAIAADPSSSRGYEGRAMIRFQTGDIDGAHVDFDKALELDDSSAVAFAGRGSTRYRKGDFQGAVEDSDRALQLEPSLIAVYVNRGGAYRGLGRFEEAQRDLDHVVEAQPDAFRPRLERARLYADRRMKEEATADLEIALQARPNDADALSLQDVIAAIEGPGGEIADTASIRQPLSSNRYLRQLEELRATLQQRRQTNPRAGLNEDERQALRNIFAVANGNTRDDLGVDPVDLAFAAFKMQFESDVNPDLLTPEQHSRFEERVMPMIVLYTIGEYCAAEGVSFSDSDVDIMLRTIAMLVDGVRMPRERIDFLWNTVATSMDQMKVQTTVDDCVESRETAGFTFHFPSTTRSNPFVK